MVMTRCLSYWLAISVTLKIRDKCPEMKLKLLHERMIAFFSKPLRKLRKVSKKHFHNLQNKFIREFKLKNMILKGRQSVLSQAICKFRLLKKDTLIYKPERKKKLTRMKEAAADHL